MWSTTVTTIAPGAVARWLIFAGWQANLVFAIAAALTAVLAMSTDQPAILSAVLDVTMHGVLGVWLSFAIHELGHAVALSRSPGVVALTLQRTAWRISVSAHGTILGRYAFAAALAGPGSCVLVGLILWCVFPQLLLHGWYLAHGLFLIPIFADGRALLAGTAAWRRPLSQGETTP